VSPDEPVEARPVTDSGRERKFTIRWMMVMIFTIAVMLGWALDQARAWRRNGVLGSRFMVWHHQFMADNPSITLGELAFSRPIDLRGSNVRGQGHYTTPTGRRISIDLEARSNPFEDRGQLVISAEGRSVTWPVKDMERGRRIDLKAEFPEAFR
jgi:hypothetical protein